MLSPASAASETTATAAIAIPTAKLIEPPDCPRGVTAAEAEAVTLSDGDGLAVGDGVGVGVGVGLGTAWFTGRTSSKLAAAIPGSPAYVSLMVACCGGCPSSGTDNDREKLPSSPVTALPVAAPQSTIASIWTPVTGPAGPDKVPVTVMMPPIPIGFGLPVAVRVVPPAVGGALLAAWGLGAVVWAPAVVRAGEP